MTEHHCADYHCTVCISMNTVKCNLHDCTLSIATSIPFDAHSHNCTIKYITSPAKNEAMYKITYMLALLYFYD